MTGVNTSMMNAPPVHINETDDVSERFSSSSATAAGKKHTVLT
jgi:hypothetical protein